MISVSLQIMKAALALVSLAALTFAGLAAGLFFSRPPDYSQRVAELELRLKEADAEIAKLKADALKSKPPAPSSARTGSASTQSSQGLNSSSPDGAPDSSQSFTKLMKDPKMRDMVKAQQGMQIEMQYSRLFSRLQLDDTETTHFKKLLNERMSAKTDMGFKLMDGALSKDQRKAVSDEYDEQKKQSDSAIRTFLNDENDYKTFQHWEDTEPERMQMMMGRMTFENAGVPLSAEQEEQLIDLMSQVRKSPSALPDMSDPKNISPDMLNNEQLVNKLLEKTVADGEAVRKGAAAFLSPEQLAALAKYQEQMKAMAEMGLKMSRTMMGTNKK